MPNRELTAKEKRELRRLIYAVCANFDSERGCLYLDSACFMLGKVFTGGALCKWFANAIMPLDPQMGRLFTNTAKLEVKSCKICGKAFPLNGRQAYCSHLCAKTGKRKADAEKSRQYRRRKRNGERVTN